MTIFLLGGMWHVAAAQQPELPRPSVNIIIDDLGDRLAEGRQAVQLPYRVSLSFLPHTPFAKRLASHAYETGKEILLHLPMEATNGKAMGPGGLGLAMQRQEFLASVRKSIDAVPHVTGINNHMGSLLTQRLQPMRWLMGELSRSSPMLFVDSKTTRHSVALDIALQTGVRATHRDLFLDHKQDADFINHQFDLLIHKAKNKGSMLAIAHPFALSLSILEKRLGELEQQGIELVSVAEYIENNERRRRQWQASLSR